MCSGTPAASSVGPVRRTSMRSCTWNQIQRAIAVSSRPGRGRHVTPPIHTSGSGRRVAEHAAVGRPLGQVTGAAAPAPASPVVVSPATSTPGTSLPSGRLE